MVHCLMSVTRQNKSTQIKNDKYVYNIHTHTTFSFLSVSVQKLLVLGHFFHALLSLWWAECECVDNSYIYLFDKDLGLKSYLLCSIVRSVALRPSLVCIGRSRMCKNNAIDR